MPFITEEIYQLHYKKLEKVKSIHLCEWDKVKLEQKKLDKLSDLHSFVELISKIRQEKTKAHKPMNAEIMLNLEGKTQDKYKDFLQDFKNVINAREIKRGRFKVEFV